MFTKHSSVVTCVTLAVRPATPRMGREHVYTLNGSRLRDILVDGRWVTVAVGEAAVPAMAGSHAL
jgi:hypothetical protein